MSISDEAIANNDLFQIHKAKDFGIDIIQTRYNWIYREAEKEVIPECIKLEMGIIARQPLSYGFLSGRYDATTKFPKNDVRHWLSKESILGMANCVRILKSELREGTDIAQWSIGWCLRNRNIHSVIVGCKTPKQVTASIKSIEIYANDY